MGNVRAESFLDNLWQSYLADGSPKWNWKAQPRKSDLDKLLVGTDVETLDQELDALAILVASRFLDGQYDFEFCDLIINAAFSYRTPFDGSGVFNDIYLAFDEGEFDHQDGRDPVKAFTIPMLEKVIART